MSSQSYESRDITIVESAIAKIKSVRVRISRANGDGLIIIISDDGFEFYASENEAGTVIGAPVLKRPADIFEWIEDEMPANGRKPLGRRVGLQKIGNRAIALRKANAEAHVG